MKKQLRFLVVSATIIFLLESGICISAWYLCHAAPLNNGAITAEKTVINERLLTNVTLTGGSHPVSRRVPKIV